MAYAINAKSERTAFLSLIKLIKTKGNRNSRYLELHNCVLSIPYNKAEFILFRRFEKKYIETVGETAAASLLRAKRVFTSMQDRVTKPSYIKRLTAYNSIYKNKIIEINQLNNIAAELATKPGSSTLVFNFFNPIDLLNKQRQGYVPCPVTGDFKFRKNKLHLNVFFRSQDILNFFYPDVIYMREIQERVLKDVKGLSITSKFRNAKIGDLTFHYSRVFIPLSMEWTPKNYVNKKEIMIKVNDLEFNLKKQSKNWA